jgi:hypothetical protein
MSIQGTGEAPLGVAVVTGASKAASRYSIGK